MGKHHVHDWVSTGGYKPHIYCNHCDMTLEQDTRGFSIIDEPMFLMVSKALIGWKVKNGRGHTISHHLTHKQATKRMDEEARRFADILAENLSQIQIQTPPTIAEKNAVRARYGLPLINTKPRT